MPSPSQRVGFAFEAVAEGHLVAEGYRIAERNWRWGPCEIDRIGWDGHVLCFIEVRYRRSLLFGTPAETVHRKKQGLILRGASVYLARFEGRELPPVRFDVVAVSGPDPAALRIELFRGAFGGHG